MGPGLAFIQCQPLRQTDMAGTTIESYETEPTTTWGARGRFICGVTQKMEMVGRRGGGAQFCITLEQPLGWQRAARKSLADASRPSFCRLSLHTKRPIVYCSIFHGRFINEDLLHLLRVWFQCLVIWEVRYQHNSTIYVRSGCPNWSGQSEGPWAHNERIMLPRWNRSHDIVNGFVICWSPIARCWHRSPSQRAVREGPIRSPVPKMNSRLMLTERY